MDYELFPNPVIDELKIVAKSSALESEYKISIFDISGRRLLFSTQVLQSIDENE